VIAAPIIRLEAMRQVSSSIARTRLYELLDDVERGETVVITRYGKPIARLEPDEKAPPTQTIETRQP